jgi:hypothetical protein
MESLCIYGLVISLSILFANPFNASPAIGELVDFDHETAIRAFVATETHAEAQIVAPNTAHGPLFTEPRLGPGT